MDSRTAADVRDALNELDCVDAPDDDSSRSRAFSLARVHQPGYSNGEPHYEVLLTPEAAGDSVPFPTELIGFLAERDYYARVDQPDGTVHVRGGLLETAGGEN